jgi:hypothetical protein
MSVQHFRLGRLMPSRRGAAASQADDRVSAPTSEADARVLAWKTAWREGAAAAWESPRTATNPYAKGLERTAWAAGWNWGGQNPDRRGKEADRLAHPLRRATDSTLPRTLKRAAAVGATGVTVYAITKVVRRWFR